MFSEGIKGGVLLGIDPAGEISGNRLFDTMSPDDDARRGLAITLGALAAPTRPRSISGNHEDCDGSLGGC